jgi:hypothetical protein
MATLRSRPAYTDGLVTGRVSTSTAGWRIALLLADEPGPASDPETQAPRSEGAILASMVAATDVGKDGRFSFGALRDGYYQLALLSPAGTGVGQLAKVTVRGDPGVFRLDPSRKTKDVGTIALSY